MKKILFTLTFAILSTLPNIANNDSIIFKQLREEILLVEYRAMEQAEYVKRLQKEVVVLNRKLKQQAKSSQEEVDSLKAEIEATNNLLMKSTKDLKGEIGDVELFSKKETNGLQERLKNWSFVGATAFLLFAFVIIVVIVFMYRFLRKRIKSSSSAIDCIKNAQSEISNAQNKLQQDALKLDEKLIELLDKQLNIQQEKGVDHSLAKKVADEIVHIEVTLSRMDTSVKGHKHLSAAVRHIKNNFLAHGYEIVDMLGKPYNEGMRINADFVINEDLKEGERIITSIAKPQINYNGEIIQKATVTVSQNI